MYLDSIEESSLAERESASGNSAISFLANYLRLLLKLWDEDSKLRRVVIYTLTKKKPLPERFVSAGCWIEKPLVSPCGAKIAVFLLTISPA